MKTHALTPVLALGVALGWFFPGAQAQAKTHPAYDYLERSRVRVAVIPGVNRTGEPGAPIVLDKAWEKILQAAAYEVVPADSVVTYAASRGILLSELPKRSPAEMGKDLKVELLLTSEIFKWEISTKGLRAVCTLEVVGRLVETTTGATVWEHHWIYEEVGGGKGLGKLIDASNDTVSDKIARMAQQAVMKMSADLLPRAGYSQGGKRH
ncbi:MAG: hypothetical protein ACLQU4_06185 [Limisphaerales bacterium]